ncbi:dystonin isoform X6 [Neopelma chrysocephalum]|uniref:dystonin isoform X6 n=1 Tax=Neopelma chrysocephalum TaxID=114329 RepID=UPI000FCD4971|nr:dystonin isoform X6 [Neopelma chrysocephalum]
MIAAAFLVLLRPYSIQCALFLLLLLLGTIATILFFCCWHRRLQKGRHPIKSVFSGRSRSRDAVMRTHHFRSEVIYLARNFKGFRSSPRHARRRVAPRLEETQPIVEAHHLSEQETSVRKRKIKKSSRVQPEFYHSVQVTPTRKPSSGNASYRCSMSSSADFSDEEDFSQRSGTVSPAPGDTLPWNLPKHERSKRKIQGGSVLDPAERAVLRIADERDKVQKKTFTKWINQHLMKVRKHVNDLYEDLRDGHNLISLLEVLSGDTLPRERDFLKTLRLVSSTEACANEQHEDVEDEDKGPREKGRMRFHRLQNVQIALDYLKKRQVKLVNIRNDDITDGNPKLTLGLIWTIILHFQISDIHVTGESEDMSAKERLLLWSQQTTEGYAGIRCENFTTCWRDGRLFNAIIHKYRPDLIDMNTVAVQSNLANLEHAFFVAEKLGVARLLDPEDVDVSSPDEKSVITYVSSLYDAFPKVPEGGEGISANDVEVKWVEYQNMVNYLMQWIRHHVMIMSDRTFPNNPVELKALYNQYLQFKETEIPPKETDKSKIKRLYKLLEVWIEFGRIKLSQGYHPNDIEKEWGKLIIAMLEREKTLRPEVERLEMLQQIANRIQRDSRSCEDKLILARNALQSDTKRLESGLQFQHEAEVAGYILESENLLRQQVVDAQILIDGKYYQADQLVQRVAKLRDELMALRTECSSVYNKGHALTTEQTKLMISGITESLNSGFTTNLTPELNAAMTQGLTPTLASSSLTSGLSSGLTSRLTPTITPAYPPGIPPRLIQSYVTGVDSGTVQTLKLMQIRKPLMKSAFVDQNLTEEEVNMKFVQDLLSWVEEMQVQLDRTEWGSDLPSVESHLENHKNVHKAIEEFESSLKEAKMSEIQMTAPLKLSYVEKLHKLESQYSKLLNTSRNQERHLDTLHNFVSRATRELIWLNEKEEEEVAYDWSERNSNIARKKEYHAELMRELDEKEEVIKSVQEIAEQLLLENHPARLTIEAYRAAMQTQWSWILQLCHCVEQHLRENAAYFEFFSDAKEAMEYLKNLKDTIYRKYSCDRSSSVHRLEDLVQESMEEKEQLLQYKSTVAGLVGRAKAIIQLKPRNPDCVLKTSIPIKAICDYRQIEITIYKDDECILANNSHRAKWKVISPSGNEAMVPSVCFTVPPPNKEAIDTANRIEQQFQNVLALWHESHVNMKSVVSWHYLTNEIEAVRAGNVASIKTMLPGEHQQVLSNLQSRFDDFLEDSQESKIFTSSDTAQLEREVNVCKQYYQELLKSAEREEQEESIYNLYISEVRNIRLRLETCEERLIRQIRTPMERDDVHENVLRISEQEKLKKELDRLKDDLGAITDKCEEFFGQAAGSPSVPTLRSELNVVIQNMNQVYSMSSIFIDKLKTINLVLTNTQTAESLVKHYETKLCEEEAVMADKNHIENLMGTLKQWRSEVDEKRQTFHALEDELQKAKMISDQMFKMHKERDLDFDWHKEKVDQLAERWQNVHCQIENRLRDLEGINKSLKYYKDTYNSLDTWIQQVEDTQRKIQEIHPENSKALAKQLNQHKMLVSEIEMKQSKIDECQKYSEQYSAAVKDYELQTMTYRAMVDSQQKSPVKRRRIQSSSDFIIQEFMDLRTRYTALVTLMTQYIKFAGDSLKRLEEEESLPEESELQQPVKSAEVFQRLDCNEAVELREENKPNGCMMDMKYLQKDNSSSKPEHTENKLEIDRRKLNVDRYDKIKIDRILKQFLNFSGQESSISGNRDNKLHREQESVMGSGNQSKEEKNGRKDFFVSAQICVSVNNDPGEMLNEKIVNGERWKTEGISKKLPGVEIIHKTTGKKHSRKVGSDVSTKEQCELQSETNFELTTKKAEVTPKAGKHALGINPHKQQHFSPHFECQHKEHCFTESNSHNTLNSEDREFQVCYEKGDSLSGARDATSLEKVASSFRELAVHSGSEKTKLNLQSMSNPDVYCNVETDTVKLQRESLDKSYFLVENKILEKSNLNPNEAKSTMQEISAVSSGNISETHYAEKVSESYPLDFEVSPVQNDRSLGTELLGNACDLNADFSLSEIISGEEDYFPLSEHELTKKLLSQDEKLSVKKISEGNIYGLDNINISGKKQSGEDRLEEGQKCKNLLLVAEMVGRDEGHSTNIPRKNTKLQKTFWEKIGKKPSFEKKEKQKKRDKDNEEKRSTTIIKKSMEEEKKEHVEKAGDLLKWVSNLSKTLSKEEGEKTEKTDLPKQQISLHEMSTKKEQIAEALQTTQSFLAKHSDKMTDEERHEMEKQVRSLQESYSLLSSEALKQLQEVQYLGDEKMEEKDVAERQQECKEKLQEICDLLTQTENRLIGQRESLVIGDSKAELEQYQTKQEEIQKDMRRSAQTLAEIVKNTETFLKENGEKLSQEDKTILEQKLNEAKTKCLLLSQKAEESKKELDKAMTTAIKQETEKVAAIEQLEESKNTIENLLDWLSNVDKEAEHGRKFKKVIEQNGTHFEEGDVKVLEGEEDDVNGNLLEMQPDIETQVDGLVKSTDDNLNQQYQKVKAQHEKIISQQQAIIVATQSAQALLEKQGHYLSPEEKDKMQRNMKELKAQYETALAESERKMKLTHSLREELEKFDADYSEFETWLQQAEQELDNLEAGASDFSGIMVKLKRQKSFSEDVISHKGDLRYITISGQRVLDAARSCSKRDGVKVDKDGIDTSATYTEVQNKLDSASDRFKSLYTKCSILGNNLKDLVDKYQHYEDASSGLLSGLQASEIAVNKQLSEPIAVDPKNLQRQLEETKVLQGQVSNHQIAVEKLKKAAEVLLDTRGELTPDKDEIQKTLDDIVERYDNLSKSVNERNEKLQVTLTRSLSVQDGLDEMLDWMEGVEKSLKEQEQVPLNSAAIQDNISKSIMLEQDIAGRQSSINTMNEKVKKFTETADPSTASTLQAKMSELAGRFSEASNKHREKLLKMEELKTKVELFEGLSEKLQSFLDEKNQALGETEAPRKDVSEVSQYMQEASVELAQHKKDLEVLKQLLEELSFHALPGDKALVSEKVNALSKKFKEVEETIKEKEEDVSSCQKQMDTFELLVESLKKWIKETTERIPAAQPSLNTEELKKPLEDTLNLKDEWTLKAPELQKMNSRGTLLCNLITAVTSPAKLRAVAKSGGTILNGEAGAPGTQDFLKNKELTTVQQAMSDVNHSYEDLGVLLNEKISELESMLSKMQSIQEESTSMMHWLQKMDKTASDWEAAPTDSEAVKAQVEQHKLFETELKQSANKVQELKDKVTELLEKNSDSPEAPKWRQTLDKIDSKWKELNQVTSERQQKLEESSNYLMQFQTAEAQLKHWLVEKELMVSVLGPLSIDPNMLNTQKQQVQILLKEFDTRKPQYEQLTMAGEGILKRPGEHPPSHEVVKEQLAAVAQKWDSLTGQLRKRCDRIDQAIVKSTEYQNLLRSLSDKLSALDNKLSSSLAVSTQPDAVKQQLEIAREMKEEIEQEMKNINAAQTFCEELSTLVGEEYLKAELTRQLDGILKSFKDIEQKSDNHVQQLQSAYTTSHQFQQMSKDFQTWLSKKKEELNQAHPVSAKLDVLQSLIEEQKEFKKTMTDQISSYERIVAEGESILQKTQGADKAALQSQIATLRNNWDEMNKQVKEREDKLTDCLEKALKYKEHVENLQPWIEKCQSNLCELKVGINPIEIENSIAQVRAWQKDLDKHHGMVELLNNSAESLLRASQTDKEIVQEETKVLNQNVNVVTEQLHKKRECLENMAQRLKEFQESSRETEKQLKSAKEHLEVHDSLGPQSFSNKHLTMMQAQQKALQALKPHVDLAKKLAQDLVVEASDSAGVSDLLLQAESLEQEYTAVNKQVEDRCSFLETKLQGIGHFQNSIREMFSQFAEFDDELDSMAPVGRDLKVLQSQREDLKYFMKKLEDLIMNNENANKNCKMMLATEAEASPDLVGIKRDLEALNKQCNKLLDRAKAREDQIEDTICRVEEFYSKLKEFSNLLGRAEEHEESQGPVGMETETINQQLNTFKVFQKEEIEPLQVKQQEVNWLGQGLIQSAAKSTNTENLEHDLEDVNTRWKTLNKKVAQRAAQLQEALLHCGRFQDALESLLSWLIDTEDLVANQKPPSAEFKVVKAQIQEQKLLQRLLDDRKPTVEAIKREGEKIAESAEPADRVKILKQLSFLDSRWDALLSKAETRNRQLEGISVVAQQFHEALEPLVEWLSTTEKRLANAEPIGTQASKLQQQIAQHKALEDDVLAHNKSLHQAISAGQSLKTMSSREDKDMVQEKLDSSQARFIEIQEKSNSRSELLQQAYSNAQIFGEDEVELMNWLNEIHDKLNRLSVQDCSTELLEKQHTELLDLQEEILLRKQNVDLAIQNGLELLKQTTGDEVVIVQDKLEGIKARYKDIMKLSSDVSKTLEQALQLAGQLHSTHEQLCKWLDEVEVELLSYETQIPKGEELSQVQERQKELKKEAKNNKGLLDTLNEVGSAFLELVPWRAREGLDKMITEDNERYRLVSDTISQKVDEIDAAILRSQQFDQAADAEFAWIAETEKKLMSLGDIRLEQDQTMAQLQVQKAFTMEILRHKDTIDELVKSGDKIMKTCTEEEKQMMKKKMESLLQKYDAVCQMNSERNLQLERAQSLVNQFWETYEELWPWLTETEMIISQLPAPALEYETLKQQQEEHRQLRELIAEHKPHIDKMNKTGPQLLELSPGEGFSIQEKYVAADILYSKIKEDVKKRALALDEAISQCTQFHDKIDPTLESLKRIAERLRQPPSISAEVEKIKEQISENKNVSVDLEKLQPVYETLKQRGEEMIARSEGTDKDISAKAVQDKLDQMVLVWEDIQTLAEEREAKLLDVMELAEKFWCDHMALVATIKDTQDFIRELEGPGVDPSVVKQQQEAAEAAKEEIDGLQEELETVVSLGSELRAACGEPDKPIVNKSIDELNSAWDALNKTWKERVDKLAEAMQAAVQYQDGLQALFDWVDIAGSKLASMSPVGTDLETVKQQTEELKQFKTEAYQQQIEMERLNHQAELLLKKVTQESDKHTVQDPLSELKILWDSLEEKIISRQHKLEGALLALGQFQHALDELLTWLTHTEDLLNEQKPVGGDPKAIEIELAKHHVLQNDVLAHQSTVEAVKKAGNDLIESSAVEEASNLRSKLELLNQRWQNLLEKTEQRKQQLDSALIQAQGFHGEVEDLQQWLTDTERQLLASKPVGGLPETAREQLNAHMELCAAFEAKEETYKCLMQKGQQMLARCPETAETNVEQDINNLKEKWESVQTKLSERKTKLEEALSLATEFHNSLQDFINWLTQAEQTLTAASRPSLILDTVLFQIDEHKVFATEVNSHRDQIIELDKTGTHLKYFSQKQDVVLIKNLLISVQSRWEKVVQRLVERGRALDDARKRAKQFHEAWHKLMEWLEESEKSLDSDLEIANDPDKIKTQLAQHKEFQKSLGAKHSVYDTTNRTGRSLKEKTTLADDNLKLDNMLSELRDKWDTICGKSVERQNKLEEALLFSGQFTDALQALIDWLYKIEPQLAEDQPVHGDIDLVMNLIDNHKVFQKELGKRTSSVQALKRSARELIEGSRDDSSWVKVQMQELSTRWETVCALSVSKQTRLEQALRQAEEFHSVVHVLLEWLAEAEQALRFHGILPDDEEALRTLIEQHREFMKKLEEKKAELNKATGMGEAILAICHPDSITTIKHWITIIRARFEEVVAWAKQHQQRLAGALAGLIANQELLEALLSWLQWAETTLTEKDKEVIPQEIEEVKALIAEHQTFMEEMTRKQPDVDKVTKTHKRKALEPTPVQSHIPVLDKGRAGRKRSPTPGMYPSATQAQIETKNPRVNLLVSKWQQVWLLALERRRKLNDALDRLEELREFANFDFDIWRKKYMRWMNHKKSRVMDFFRRIDKDQDGKITRQEFIDGILSSKFPTSRLEMSAVADIFDRDGDGYIDYYEFVAALHPNKDAYKPLTDADKIEDEVTRQVAKCKCAKRFQVEQIGDNKYRFFLGNQFGDSQQLRLVRILRSTVMVRVGGGWMALDEFLVKNDPCRVHHHGSKMLRSESNSSITTQPTIAKGRTNVELREKFILADGASQSMAAFRPRGRRSRPSSRGASPNRSTSLSSQAGQAAATQAVATSTPKTPHHLIRNYGKPWLTNSKTSTPSKPSESSDYQGSSAEGTPIQGSKLRLPGYLSGKGFQSGEDSGILSTAATRVRAQFADTRRTPSRPGSRAGSKAGSRSSSRRGSDASDFDISEIQSVCSDMSETVPATSRPTPRAGSRPGSAKPSKIPTPQRRPLASKSDKSLKR